MKRCFVAVLALACAFSLGMYAQEFRATIGGAVTDASGASVSGAKITVTETNTNTKVETSSDASGKYTVPFLLPGTYDVSVKLEGFKEFVRRGLHLGSGETPTIDAKLEVGESMQSVVVTDEVSLIVSENASIGQTITTKEVEDLPSNGGTPYMAIGFSMGVIATSSPSQVLPYASGGGSSWSISGSPNQTNELLVDGVPNTTWDGRMAYSPQQDAVQEVKVKAFDTDAAYGHTGAGTANVVLKSGTNTLHGSLYEKNQPNNLVANNFFNNKTGLPVQVTHFNQYGLTAGGPIYLPKIVDARNKVFWFFGFEGVKDSQPSTTLLTVPTAAERQGDFSKLLTLRAPLSPTVLYDPYTATLNGTTVTRTAYPNNKIPASQFNPIALKYLSFFPQPNITLGVRADDYNNFGNNNASTDGYTNELGRLDYNFSQSNRTYFNIRHTDYYQTKNDYYSNIATGSNLSRSNLGASIDHVYMLNATNVINVRANFTRMFEDHSAPSAGFNPTELGFPAYLAGNSQYLQLPLLSFNSAATNIQNIGFGTANKLPSQSMQLFGDWVALRGNHTLKFGADARQYRFNYLNYGNATGTFSFSGNNWVRQASNSSSTGSMGQDLASFLLGLPTGGSYDLNSSGMFYSYYGAVFVQDDWRIRRNLTINLGLRFDHDFPFHERWGRTVNGFDFDALSPLNTAAKAAYANSPSPLLPASQFNVRGGLSFANPDNSAIFQNTSHLVSPRVGIAWTPEKLHGKTVIRSGFGMFVAPITIATLQISGAYSTSPILAQEGFSQSTTLVSTNDNNLTPAATLSNPFPNGIQKAVGSAAGLNTFVGQSINFLNPKMKSPYSVRWNFSIQHEISRNTVLEVAYIGNHSVHLPVTYTNLNAIPRRFLSTSPVRDQAVINALSATVPNPFRGLATPDGTASTLRVDRVVSPYPQFPFGSAANGSSGSSGVIMQDNNVGSSYFQSLNVRLQRRLSRGVQVNFNFMQSKNIDQTTWLNDSDPTPERRISPFFRPTRVTANVIYELPFGRGRHFDMHSRALDAAFGGWQFSTTYTYQVGGPVLWVNGSSNNNADYIYFGGKLDSQPRNIDGYSFDISRFNTKSTDALQYHIRSFSTTFSDVRADGINEFNTSLLKKFSLGEKRYFQLRCELFNTLNHPTFAAPNTQQSNSAFGTITATANRPRFVQFVARFVF